MEGGYARAASLCVEGSRGAYSDWSAGLVGGQRCLGSLVYVHSGYITVICL